MSPSVNWCNIVRYVPIIVPGMETHTRARSHLIHISHESYTGWGYDMDILSGKSYDVTYHGYDFDIPNANNLEWHILVIYFLTFGQIV